MNTQNVLFKYMVILIIGAGLLVGCDETNTDMDRSDLVIQSFSISPEYPTIDDTITFTAVVENTGTEDAGASTATLKVGGESMPPEYEIPALDSGDTYTITREINLPIALTYLSRLSLDVNDDVDETDEINNEEELVFTVAQAPQPDLIVQSLTISPEHPTVDDTITLTAVIENQGPGDADASIATLRVGGESVPPEYAIPALDFGDTYTIIREINLPIALTYLSRLSLDVDDDVNETDEANNEKELIFSVSEE